MFILPDLQIDQQSRDIRRIDAGYPGSLTDVFRLYPAELFSRLQPQAVNFIIADLLRQLLCFQTAHFGDFQHLFVDISLVLGLNLDLFGDRAGQFGPVRVKRCQISIAQLRTSDQICQFAAGVQRFGSFGQQQLSQGLGRRNIEPARFFHVRL